MGSAKHWHGFAGRGFHRRSQRPRRQSVRIRVAAPELPLDRRRGRSASDQENGLNDQTFVIFVTLCLKFSFVFERRQTLNAERHDDHRIILPVYDEEEGLPIFHDALSGVLAGLSSRYAFRVIYVLDRCRDNSLCRSQRNRVPGRARHRASSIASVRAPNVLDCRPRSQRWDASILMDCDLQHPPQVIPQVTGEIRTRLRCRPGDHGPTIHKPTPANNGPRISSTRSRTGFPRLRSRWVLPISA